MKILIRIKKEKKKITQTFEFIKSQARSLSDFKLSDGASTVTVSRKLPN